VDTTNARVGINRTPGAFDLDVNNAANVGGTLTFGVGTITGLTINNSPVGANDYFLYYSAAANAFRRCTVAACASAATAGVSSLNGTTGGLTLAASGITTLITSGSTFTVATPPLAPQGRLTLLTATPVMTTSQSAKTTLLYDCYQGGNKVPYFDGTNDQSDTIGSCEVSDAMVSAASAGQVVNANVYDVWWVHGGGNRICLAMSASTGGGGGWSADVAGSNTARGTGYSQLDTATRPYITNKNAITNCFNGATNYGSVSANQGTYLGTVYASANGQVSYTFGASGAGGVAGLLGVWNAYNRVLVTSTVLDSATTYTVASSSFINAHSSATYRNQYVMGMQEDAIRSDYFCTAQGNGVNTARCGIGHDSASSAGSTFANGANAFVSGTGSFSTTDLGFHYMTAAEQTGAGVTLTYTGTSAPDQAAFTSWLRM
jgi:hypothetical protein